jgi:hypothetical protein
VRDVGAGDEQDEGDRREEDEERGADVADDLLLQRDGGDALVRARVLLFEAAIAASSARARASVTPGRSVANERSDAPCRSSRRSSSTSGAASSAPVAQYGAKRKPGGMTPTTVYGSPLSIMVRPTTAGSAAKRRRHDSCVSTTTRLRPACSSSGRKPRPSSGRTPSRGRMSAVTRTARISSALSRPVRLGVQYSSTPIHSNDRLAAFQSRNTPAATVLPRP